MIIILSEKCFRSLLLSLRVQKALMVSRSGCLSLFRYLQPDFGNRSV